tara:strand:+ start:35355 stop:35684 length:330 start_codon:yes stop_codon:yes gene_type:complete
MSKKLKNKTDELSSTREIAKHSIILENDEIIVTHWSFNPGEQTGWHIHEMDYMPIQLSKGKLMFEFTDGTTKEINYVPRTTSIVTAPLEHNAINTSDEIVVALEIEFKK